MSGNGGLFPITLNVFTVLYSLRQAAKPPSPGRCRAGVTLLRRYYLRTRIVNSYSP